ncbi:MAG: Smr/MutS family protein, partial [Bacteroidetes bacterium]|nr:Smr/MutS family protein [Bacteroidota bacterium]
MKFSIGDRVWLKRSDEEGEITAFLGQGLVEVQVGEIRFPAFEDELEHPYLHWFTQSKKKSAPTPEPKIPEPEKPGRARLPRGIYLSFFPDYAQESEHEIITGFALQLLNETAEAIQFRYESRPVSGSVFLSLQGKMPAFSNLYLHRLSLELLNDQPRFLWQLAPQAIPLSATNELLRIRSAQLIRHIQTLIQDGAPSFSILLRENAAMLPEVKTLPIPRAKAPESAKKQAPIPRDSVVDLHMSPGAGKANLLLPAQLQLLEQALHDAFLAGSPSLIVIHGLGSGTLRKAVHQLLQ